MIRTMGHIMCDTVASRLSVKVVEFSHKTTAEMKECESLNDS